MNQFGTTRSVSRRDHLLQTPDTFVRAPRFDVTSIIHISPAAGAKFLQYTAEFESGGLLRPAGTSERFVYLLEGELEGMGGYAYFPPGDTRVLTAGRATRAVVIEKSYEPLPGTPPPLFFSAEKSLHHGQPLPGGENVEVQSLVQPGATLPGVEVHVMEHGLLMRQGSGIYRLNDSW